MYSIGVILFEMFHKPFGTGMERIKIMNKFRDFGELPDNLGVITPASVVDSSMDGTGTGTGGMGGMGSVASMGSIASMDTIENEQRTEIYPLLLPH